MKLLMILKAIALQIKVIVDRLRWQASALCLIKKNGGKVGFPVLIEKGSKLEGKNRVGKNSRFKGELGYGSYISDNCCINASIGRFTCVAGGVKTLSGTHPYKYPFAAVSPLFYSTRDFMGPSFAREERYDELRYFDRERKISVKIGNDCWIGEGVIIVGGIEIGDGAVVLAGAVVTKNVPPYSIVGGVPASVKDYRYDKETIEFLSNSKWWEKEPEWFKCNWALMNDVLKLKNTIS